MLEYLKCLFTTHNYILVNTVYLRPMQSVAGIEDVETLRRLIAGSTEHYYTCSDCGKEKLVIRNGDWRNR